MLRFAAFSLVFVVTFASTFPVTAAEREKNTSFKIESGQLVLPDPILFKTGSDEIKEDDSEKSLWLIADFLDTKSYISLLRIEGHVSASVGAGAQELSEKRAAAVAKWLIAHGVDSKRLIAVGFGGNKPAAAEDSPEGKAANTRIEVHPAAMRDHLIGGNPADGGGKEVKIESEKK